MKPAKVETERATLDEIVETLKRVPKARLRTVRDVAEALAEPGTKAPPTLAKEHEEKELLGHFFPWHVGGPD